MENRPRWKQKSFVGSKTEKSWLGENAKKGKGEIKKRRKMARAEKYQGKFLLIK